MRTISLPPATLGAAILLHLALLPLRPAPSLPALDTTERIEIRFAAEPPHPTRTPEAPTPVPPPPLARQGNVPLRAPAPPAPPISSAAKPTVAEPAFPAPAPAAAPAAAAAANVPPASVAPALPAIATAPVAAEPAASAPATPTTPVAASRLGEFLEVVHRAVEDHKEYPSFARQLGQQGRVLLQARILADGRLGEATVLQSSGHPSLDKAALAALRRATPLRSPATFGLGAVTVEIPIVFRLI